MAWSGDVTSLLVPAQTATQDFQWALPAEGGMLWTDNMVVPKGSPNRRMAESWIDFYYEPTNAATIEPTSTTSARWPAPAKSCSRSIRSSRTTR